MNLGQFVKKKMTTSGTSLFVHTLHGGVCLAKASKVKQQCGAPGLDTSVAETSGLCFYRKMVKLRKFNELLLRSRTAVVMI